MINSILIANRGEIACRIIRTAKRMGIETVAVYSDSDAGALHTQQADRAVALEGTNPTDTYLDVKKIITIAKRTGCDAIHPGYGFLSENAGFAEACSTNGICFIGPSAGAITQMGSKSAAKQLMGAAGVPLVPGYHGDEQSSSTLLEEARGVGFPVMIKASAGGGGKGMRIVESDSDFEAALLSVKRESVTAFGDDHVLIEKYIREPRHIEIQIFGDSFANHVHLYERDCSVQRRHQKIIEEAPAPGLTEERRQAMGDAAINAAKAIDYEGAGTVEFIVDKDGEFFFMEMNTRLQVEHPITEMITGLDLVEWQIRIARGEQLPLNQSELDCHGHSIEARIYAENVDSGFLPSTGTLKVLNFPAGHRALRVETGVQAGDTISTHFDPMIAKIVSHGSDRLDAIERLFKALDQIDLLGLTNNIVFLKRVLASGEFRNDVVTTGFLTEHQDQLCNVESDQTQNQLATMVCGLCLVLSETDRADGRNQCDGWRLNLPATAAVRLAVDEQGRTAAPQILFFQTVNGVTTVTAGEQRVEFSDIRLNSSHVGPTTETSATTLECHYTEATERLSLRARVIRSGNLSSVQFLSAGPGTNTQANSTGGSTSINEYLFRIVPQDEQSSTNSGDDGNLLAPMPGKVTAVLVSQGQTVEHAQPLMVLEAMKMEHTITAPAAGEVSEIFFGVDESVEANTRLLAMTSVDKADSDS